MLVPLVPNFDVKVKTNSEFVLSIFDQFITYKKYDKPERSLA